MNNKKILITGSNGFIFSNFIRQLCHSGYYKALGYDIALIDYITNVSLVNNIYVNKDIKFYPGDVADPHFINVVFSMFKPDYVIHAAAETHVDPSISSPINFARTNVVGTQVIVDACVKHNVKKIIYISTDEVYGQLSVDDPSWTEESETLPRNPYSATKFAGEIIVKAASKTHGLKYNITRSSNNYGPRQYHDKLIPKIIKNVLNEKEMPIYGDGKQIRDWLYVVDNCEAILKVLESGKDNEIYNISGNNEITNIDIFNKICDIIGTGHNLIKFVEDRKGHDYRYSINCDKIKSLGWSPRFTFEDGLEQCVNWYVANKWWFKI